MEPENDSELVAEIADVRDMLVRRYDEIVSGRVQPLDGEEARTMLKKRTEDAYERTRLDTPR